MECPIGKPLDDCPCKDYAKDGLCDYPYKNNMPPEPWTEIARLLVESEEGQAGLLKLGKIAHARDIGRKGHTKWMWCACSECGLERWVQIRKGIPVHSRCQKCGDRSKRVEIRKKDTLVKVVCRNCGQERTIKYGTLLREVLDSRIGLCIECGHALATLKNKGRPAWNKGLHGWRSKEHTEAIVRACKGRIQSVEEIEKRRKALIGRVHSDETKLKISNARKRYYKEHPKEQHRNVDARELLSDKNKGVNPFYGRRHSAETRALMSKLKKEYFWEHPEARDKLMMLHLGKTLSLESRTRIRQTLSIPSCKKAMSEKAKARSFGDGNNNWRGGISLLPYSFGFNELLKESIRERDGYECQICGITQNGRKLDIHHIDYDKLNLEEKRLISLCRKCHLKTGYNRNYWQEELMGILKRRGIIV